MDIQDPDYYNANTFVYNKEGDITWKMIQKKNLSNLACCETSFSKKSYHIKTSQLIWVANQWTRSYMIRVFTERCFPTDYNFAIDESYFLR